MRRGSVALHRRLNLLAWLARVERESPEISVESVVEFATGIRLGDEVLIAALVMLRALSPEDLASQSNRSPHKYCRGSG